MHSGGECTLPRSSTNSRSQVHTARDPVQYWLPMVSVPHIMDDVQSHFLTCDGGRYPRNGTYTYDLPPRWLHDQTGMSYREQHGQGNDQNVEVDRLDGELSNVAIGSASWARREGTSFDICSCKRNGARNAVVQRVDPIYAICQSSLLAVSPSGARSISSIPDTSKLTIIACRK